MSTQTLTTTSLTTAAGTTPGSTTSLSITINTTTVTINTELTASQAQTQTAPPPYTETKPVIESQNEPRASVASLRQGTVMSGVLAKEESKEEETSLCLPEGLRGRKRVCQKGWRPKVWWRNYERYRLLKKEIREAEREVEVWRARYDGGFV